MFKRILVFALAACMTINSVPMTAFATGAKTEVVSGYDAEESETVSGNVIIEEETDSEEVSSEEDVNSGEKVSTGDVEASEGEVSTGDVEASEGEVSTGDVEASEEEVSSGDAEDSKDEGSEDTGAGENAGIGEDVSSGEAGKEETLPEEAGKGEETLEEGTATGNEMFADENGIVTLLTDSSDIQALSVGVATVTLPAYNNGATSVWYSFTAPESGFYSFYADKTDSSSSTNVYLYDNATGANRIAYDSVSSYSYLSLYTEYMEAGDTIYARMHTYASEDITLSISVSKIAQYALAKQENGSYVAEADNFTFTADMEAGYVNIRGTVSITAKEGVTLSDYYRLNMRGKKADSTKSNVKEHYYYNSYGSCDVSLSVSQGTEYNVYYVLCDYNTYTPIAVLYGDVVMTTGTTDEPYVIYETTATETSVTLDVEILNDGYCYYGPVDGSSEELSRSMGISWSKTTFANLLPGKEYYFEFTDVYGRTLGTEKVTTVAYTYNVTYEAALSEDGSTLTLTANYSNYKESVDYANLYYSYVDAFGREMRGYVTKGISDIEADGENGKSFAVSDVCEPVFLADTDYEITLWIPYGGGRYKETVLTVTTPSASVAAKDITFSVAAGTTAGTADYSITAADVETNTSVDVYYKPQGDGTDNYTCLHTYMNAEGYTGTISGLQAGGTYEFILFADGVIKKVTATIGEAPIYLKAVGETEINAYDFVRTFKVEGTEELADTYYLRMYYMSGDSDYYSTFGSYVTLNADNEYQVEFSTASTSKLDPDTEYQIKWTLATSSSTYTTPVYTAYETIHTEKTDLSIEDARIYLDTYVCTVSFDADSLSNFSYFTEYVYAYIKNPETNSWRRANNYAYLTSSGGYSATLRIEGFEAETTYDVSLRNSNGKEYTSYTFTTPKDTREVSVVSVDQYFHAAYVVYSLSGMDVVENSYVHMYTREKGTEGAWENSAYNRYSESSSYSTDFYVGYYNDEQLKENTTYEYKIGFGNTYNASMGSLEKVISGEFTTAEDTRTVTAQVSAGYTKADLGVFFSGNNNRVSSYIHYLYKESDATDWTYMGLGYSYQTSASYTYTFTGLSSGTTYDYAVVVSDSSSCSSPDEITDEEAKAVGQFTTLENAYDLEFELVEGKSTYEKAVVSVQATDCQNDNVVNVALTLSDENGNAVQEQTVNLKRGNGYSKDVTFTGLLGETAYTITKAVFSVTEVGSLISIGEKTYDYTFTTKEAEVPTAIVLSEKDIVLNAIYGQYYMDGFSSKKLTATVKPATAADDFVWSSSDTNVATVTSAGVVYAVGAGEAEITVASAYDSTIKATCKVTVKEYGIGYTDNDGELQILESVITRSVYKNNSLEGYGFYEIDADGNATLLTDYTVTPVKENIVTWKEGALKAVGVGKTRVDFEKDGYKAAIYVNVSAEAVGYGIIGFEASDSSYPAIKNADGSYTLAHLSGVTYTAIGQLSPEQTFYASEFSWSVSDETVATVDAAGNITPLTQGTVTLTVTPNDEATTYIQEEVKVELAIKGLATAETGTVLYAISNVSKKLGDVAFPTSWGEDWSWKYPATPLVTNGVNTDAYSFEAVYNGEDAYSSEATIQVFIGKITGMSVYESGANHNRILETGGTDSIKLAISAQKQGTVSNEMYSIEVPEVAGLTITQGSDGYYTVTAEKAGKYTIKPVVKVGDTVVAKSSYAITAVDAMQAVSITITTDTEGVTIEDNKVIFDSGDAKKNFTLNAVVKDRSGEEIATKLEWKTTDKTVVTVAADKKDTHTAKVTAKGEGHAVISVKAKDKLGYQVQLDVEIQNHKPRVDANKATVNIAYDYDDYRGRNLAAAVGLVEIVPVYGEDIYNYQLLDKKTGTVSPYLKLVRYSGYNYLVTPTTEEIPTGAYNCTIRVTTSEGMSYDYPLKVTVQDKKPTVSAKMGSAVNLFYTNATSVVNLKISNNGRVQSIVWEDASEGVNNGFTMSPYTYSNSGKYTSYLKVAQQDQLNVVKGKLQDTSVAKGNLTVKLYGYRDSYTFKNFAVKYNYKKPSIVTKSSSTYIAPDLGQTGNCFYLYDNTNKRYMYYDESYASVYYFNEMSCEAEDVSLRLYNYYVNYTYTGNKSTNKITMNVDASIWREPVQVTHTIKVKSAKARISNGTLTFNANEKGSDTAYSYIYLDNGMGVGFTDIAVKGADAKAQKLITNDLFIFTSSGNRVVVKRSDAEIMDTTIPAGTYKYKVTPYYTNAKTGAKKAMNTLTLTIKVINKATTAKITPKGTIDLANGSNYYVYMKKNAVWIDPKFTNLASGDYVQSYKLVGEYSDYFRMGYSSGHYYVTTSSTYLGKLKAGQAYKLAVEYTMYTSEGETYTLTSSTFTIKPKQSKPKVTVSNNNQTLYAAADDVYRTYYISVPAYYSIASAYGSVDCNKDGVADITVSGGSTLTVKITDCDAVGATAKGKTYTIPVTVKVTGRDGISKDATVSIKVKVKR